MTTIIMTGGTSGIGKIALKYFLKNPDTRVILGARSKSSLEVEKISLDLASLKNVKSFVSEVKKQLNGTKINALIFNAGISLPDDSSRTIDGFETTFAVNHLAHYLLIRLLMPELADKAKIILTTSGTYDPAEKTIIPPPRHANAKLLAHPELDPDRDKTPKIAGGRAYSSSKLCVILTARALTNNLEIKKKKITVIAYDPGPTPGTRLVRNTNIIIRLIWSVMGIPLFRLFLKKMNSRTAAGKKLADLSLGKISLPERKTYAALRKEKITYPKFSELAKNNLLMNNLWNDSASLTGL